MDLLGIFLFLWELCIQLLLISTSFGKSTGGIIAAADASRCRRVVKDPSFSKAQSSLVGHRFSYAKYALTVVH